jgi:hypothetical protein
MIHKIIYIVSTITNKIKLNFTNTPQESKKQSIPLTNLVENNSHYTGSHTTTSIKKKNNYTKDIEDIDKLYYGNICFDD